MNSNLPVSPLPRKPLRLPENSVDKYRKMEKLLSMTNPFFLGPQTPTEPLTMAPVRCNKCHRYLEVAPDPSLCHDGCFGDARCTLKHHPQPCDYASPKHGDRTVYSTGAKFEETENPSNLGSGNEDLAKKLDKLDNLATQSDIMRGNMAKVEGNIGHLASQMEKIVNMLGKLKRKTQVLLSA